MSKSQPVGIAPDDICLPPALVSIRGACAYLGLGGISRAKFYVDILPLLETVKISSRNFVVVTSLNRLIEAIRHREKSRL